jgi:hypothetical protein
MSLAKVESTEKQVKGFEAIMEKYAFKEDLEKIEKSLD